MPMLDLGTGIAFMIFFFQGSAWASGGTLQGSHIGNLNFWCDQTPILVINYANKIVIRDVKRIAKKAIF